MLKKFLFVFVFLGCCQQANCQSAAADSNEKVDVYKFRPKLFEIDYQTLPAVGNSPLNSSPIMKNNGVGKVLLRFPLVMKSGLLIGGQIKYRQESLNLGENTETNVSNEFTLHNASFALIAEKKLKNDFFLKAAISGSLRSDKIDLSEFSRSGSYLGSVLVGRQKNSTTILGVGLASGESMGRFRVSPLILFEKQISARSNFDLLLPKHIKYSYAVSNKTQLLAGVKASKADYLINQSLLEDYNALEYRRLAIKTQIGINKEINDWLWFGAKTGLNIPLRSALVESGQPTRDAVWDLDRKTSPFINFSLFIVPPRKLFDKLSN